MLIHHYDSDMDLQVTLEVDSFRYRVCGVCGDPIPSSSLYLRVVAPDEMDSQDYWHLGCADLGYVDELPGR